MVNKGGPKKPAGHALAAGKMQFRTRAERLSPEKRRSQLIKSAIRVLAEKGIGHTKHTAVAAEADISPSAVFLYFPTHEELTRAVLAEVAEFYKATIIRPILANAPISHSLEDMLMAFSDSIDSHRDIARVWLDWSTSMRSGTWPLFIEFQKEARAHVRKALVEGKDAGYVRSSLSVDEAAELVVNLGLVIGQMKFSGSARARIRRTIRAVLQAILVPEQ